MPHFVPLLYLYGSLGNTNQVNLYMFLARCPQSLDKYLQDNISKVKDDQIIPIALDIADVLILLHANEIVYRNIKAKNILMDENQQRYLADIGTVQE